MTRQNAGAMVDFRRPSFSPEFPALQKVQFHVWFKQL